MFAGTRFHYTGAGLEPRIKFNNNNNTTSIKNFAMMMMMDTETLMTISGDANKERDFVNFIAFRRRGHWSPDPL